MMLLHVCCGPCSTHVAEILSHEFQIVGYFYNPNIYPYEEWMKRYEAFREVAQKSGFFADYFPKESLSEKKWETEHQKFLNAAKNLENEPEGGKRCTVCFKLRLEEAARFAFESSCHSEQSEESRGSEATRENLWFATTLTIGKNKKAEIINPIGESAGQKYGIKFYAADFKKIPLNPPLKKGGRGDLTSPFEKGGGGEGDLSGFWNSVKLSKELGIYRQHYCGCEFGRRSNSYRI